MRAPKTQGTLAQECPLSRPLLFTVVGGHEALVSQNGEAAMVKSVVFFVAFALLAACGPTTERHEAKCELEAARVLRDARPSENYYDYVGVCMKAHGFRFNANRPECLHSKTDVWWTAKPECFERY
jgi:hypothetical protein